MERHPYFELWLHSDAELTAQLPAALVARTTLHEWPLSCVQRLELADGSAKIYKAQRNEGVEAAFYACARSPLLVGARSLGLYETTSALLFEEITAPQLAEVGLSEAEALGHAERLELAIAQIAGEPPVYADLRDFTRWERFAERVCAQLAGLCADGRFMRVPGGAAPALLDWARSAAVRDAQAVTALAHADLSAGNIFITPQGYRLIDWQYPRRVAAGFDRAGLLDSLGFDPRRHVPAAVAQIFWFVRLAWFVDCKARLFPPGDSYDVSCAELLERII